MEDIKLSKDKYIFFKNLEDYLGETLIFYGSIKRIDYFNESSDIDITVITDNVNSVLIKLTNYLKIDKNKITKIYQKFNQEDKLIYGYKIKYIDEEKNLNFDILVYNKKYSKEVLQNIYEINNLPFYVTFMLYILKTIYYKLNLISKKKFLDIKNFIFYMYFNKKINWNKSTSFMTTIII